MIFCDRRRFLVSRNTVTVFNPYPFEIGQKIYIAGGPRKGDWEVIAVSDHKVKLRCPISTREFEWNRFCYFVEMREDEPWPHED
jgi:hypothetical protein